MTIKIKIGSSVNQEKERVVQAQVSLQVSKTLDGNILINDHDKMDIIIVPGNKRIVTIPKPGSGDDVYEHQKELMDSLYRGGVIKFDSVQGGPSFGMLEGFYSESDEVDSLQVALYEIDKYMKSSVLSDAEAVEYDKFIEDRFTDPNSEESTEYGEFKPEQDEPYRKSIPADSNYTFSGYGYLY
jgi:hypothetical protein